MLGIQIRIWWITTCLIYKGSCSRELLQQGFEVDNLSGGDAFSYTHPRCQVNKGNPIASRFSYMASLQLEIGGNFSHLCGAVLISPRLLLTQAHCIWIRNSTVDFRHQKGVQRSLVAGYYIHPGYKGEARSGDDLAILMIQDAAPYGVVYANYHASQLASQVQGLMALGWGATGMEELGDLNMYQTQVWPVKEVEMFEYDSGLCQTEIQLQFPDYQLNASNSLCAYPKGATMLCQGDGGGPLISPSSDARNDVLIGLVSWSKDMSCISQIGQPFVFTRLEAYIEWIDRIIAIEEGPEILQNLYAERRPHLLAPSNATAQFANSTQQNGLQQVERQNKDLYGQNFQNAIADLELHGLFTQGGYNESLTDELSKQVKNGQFVRPQLKPQNSECPTLVEVASGFQQLAAFLQAVDGAGLADLIGDGEFIGTVFAPNNGAMTPVFAILPSLATYSQYINAVNSVFGGYMYLQPQAQAQSNVRPMSQRDLLEQLLNIMIVPNLYLRSENMWEGMTLTTLSYGQSIMIHDGDIGDMLKVGPVASILNGTFMGANIIQPNIPACKAVLHIIDAVM